MKIVIDIEDKEKLLDALNNSMVALSDIITIFYLGCELPTRWQYWKEQRGTTLDECHRDLLIRYKLLEDVYKQIKRTDTE